MCRRKVELTKLQSGRSGARTYAAMCVEVRLNRQGKRVLLQTKRGAIVNSAISLGLVSVDGAGGLGVRWRVIISYRDVWRCLVFEAEFEAQRPSTSLPPRLSWLSLVDAS